SLPQCIPAEDSRRRLRPRCVRAGAVVAVSVASGRRISVPNGPLGAGGGGASSTRAGTASLGAASRSPRPVRSRGSPPSRSRPRPGGTDQRLPFTRAIDGYTSEAAYASFDETRKGILEPGKLADIVVLGSDVFAEPPATRDAAAVFATIVDGKVAYRKN